MPKGPRHEMWMERIDGEGLNADDRVRLAALLLSECDMTAERCDLFWRSLDDGVRGELTCSPEMSAE